MSNLSTGKINPSGTGSYLSEMLFIALNRNLPELVEAATEHALGITKIGKNKMFGTPAVRATPVWSPPRELVESSGGGTRICGRFRGKELHSLYSWGQTGDNFGQREVLMRDPWLPCKCRLGRKKEGISGCHVQAIEAINNTDGNDPQNDKELYLKV